MFFTQDDYRKIEQWLSKNSVKDTEFNEAITPLNGNEVITCVQNGHNVRFYIKDLIEQLFLLGVSDFLNVTDKYDSKYITLPEAISLIPYRSRKVGQVITFLNEEGEWNMYQFKGDNVNQWNTIHLWDNLFDFNKYIINSILPDEEDLTKTSPDESGNSYLKFKDKTYNPDEFSGLGRVYLRKNIIDYEDNLGNITKKNILVQGMIDKENTIYIIQYDYDLNGQEITIPENCVLQFEGGSFSNGTLVGNNTSINAGLKKIFNLNINISGKWNVEELYPQWFGAINDGEYDCSDAINKCLELARDTSITVVKLLNSNYAIYKPLNVYSFTSLLGNKQNYQFFTNTIINKADSDAINLQKGNYTNISRISIKNIGIQNSYAFKNNAINVKSDTELLSLSQCFFENISIVSFHTAFNVDLIGYVGVNSNVFTNCYFSHNVLGIHIKGSLSEEGGRVLWMNANKFNNCNISHNKIGAIFVESTTSQEQNIVDKCVIEKNGVDYTIDEKLNIGAVGFALYSSNNVSGGSIYGYFIFQNCYIEGNFPRREGSTFDSELEYKHGDFIYPLDINEQAMFICNYQKLQVISCKLSQFILLYKGYLPDITFERNDYNIPVIPYSDTPIDYLFYFSCSNSLARFMSININELNSGTSIDNRSSLYKFGDIGNSSYLRLSNININWRKPNINFSVRNGSINSPIYIDSTGTNESQGVDKNFPAKDIGVGESLLRIHSADNPVEYIIVNEVNSTYEGAHTRFYCNDFTLSGYTSSSIFRPNSKSINIYGRSIYVRNLVIYLTVNYANILKSAASSIIFHNCTFIFDVNNHYLFYNTNSSGIISFVNCTFTKGENLQDTNIYLSKPSTNNLKYSFIHCTIPEELNVISDNRYVSSSKATASNIGDMRIIDGNYMTFSDSEHLRNLDGTLYNKVKLL